MNSKYENHLIQYFAHNIKRLYVFASIAIILSYLVDTVMLFNRLSPFVIGVNIFIIVIISLFLILGLSNKITIAHSYLTIIYVTFLGLFLAYFYAILNGTFVTHFFVRNFIIFPVLIFTVGFIVNEKQMVFVGVLLAVLFGVILISSQIDELLEITPFVVTMVLITTFASKVLISSMDISIKENKSYEKQLIEHTNKLESMNKDKDNLFSVISHDLRGPVGSAKEMIRYLMDNEISDDDKKFLLSAINSSIGNSYNLLTNLLLWASNESGAMEFTPQNININKFVLESINLLSKNAEEKGITVVNEIDSELMSYSDFNLFETIIRNLLANAIKFTPSGGKIVLSNSVDESGITISVKDNGVGISEKVKNKIFSNLTITPAQGTQNEKGTGLGLKLCKEFTNKNGGKIWVESTEGKGSEFSFTIPKAKNEIS
ncbi:MAG: HAMP domain-containing histidine kinase [Bacteroidetes bacterium]|nr:HAMP domain-containing histidine kinase [Bacteroidota bacterium]MBU1114360.1 HAMP domain-containing histidine kinase [Bacteroidota bacterium]MBU1797347.1 HAMP domain-containing histidine kinase [Bacteroidota bacterium]